MHNPANSAKINAKYEWWWMYLVCARSRRRRWRRRRWQRQRWVLRWVLVPMRACVAKGTWWRWHARLRRSWAVIVVLLGGCAGGELTESCGAGRGGKKKRSNVAALRACQLFTVVDTFRSLATYALDAIVSGGAGYRRVAMDACLGEIAPVCCWGRPECDLSSARAACGFGSARSACDVTASTTWTTSKQMTAPPILIFVVITLVSNVKRWRYSLWISSLAIITVFMPKHNKLKRFTYQFARFIRVSDVLESDTIWRRKQAN